MTGETPGSPPPAAHEALVRAEALWRDCTGPESELLKMAVLRDLMRALHAERSRSLASGRKDDTLALRAWEARIEELRSAPKLDGELRKLLAEAQAARKRTRLLPEALLAALDRTRLERYDRQWEAALAAEACALGWRFWALDAWVEVSHAEEWNQRLQESAWPYAIVLFTESAPEPQPGSKRAPPPPDSPLWKGRWTLVVHPRFQHASELSLDLSRWPGSPSAQSSAAGGVAPPGASGGAAPPLLPQWKLLFSPKAR